MYIQVKLNVLNPHSSADTLNITNFASSTPLSLVGPFTSQVLYTAPYYSILEPTYYESRQECYGTLTVLMEYLIKLILQSTSIAKTPFL